MIRISILHIVKRYEKNHGPSNIINNIVSFDSDKNHIVYSLYPAKSMEKAYVSKNNVLVKYGKLNSPVGYFFSLIELIYICFVNKSKVIEGHLIHGMVIALILKLLFQAKLIVVHHNVENYFYKNSSLCLIANKVQKIIHRLSDVTICVSKGVKNALYKYGLIKNKAKIQVIYNGVDNTKYRIDKTLREQTREELGVKNDTIVIMMAGWLIQRKNTELMIEAMSKIVSDTDKQIELIIFGEGPLESHLKKLIRKYNISSTVRMLGFSNDLVPYYNAADIFCLPSFQEGFGLVLIEAMLCGTCCVGSNVAGVSEIIVENVNGKLFDVFDKDVLSATLMSLIDDPTQMQLLKDNCRDSVHKKFAVNVQALLYNNTYEALIN